MTGIELESGLVGTAGWSVPASEGLASAGVAATTGFTSAGTAGLIGSGGAVTMAGLSKVGTALTAGSLVMGGISGNTASQYNARASKDAAAIAESTAEYNAFQMKRENSIKESQLADQQQRATAKRAAAWGKSGLELAGSPIAVETGADYADTMARANLETADNQSVANERMNAAIRAAKLRGQAALSEYMGTSYLTSGFLAGGGTLLTRGAKLYGG